MKRRPFDRIDFLAENHGSIALLTPLTRRAREWAATNIDPEAQTWGQSIVVEPRYMQPILDGITLDGLEWR